MTKIKEKAKQIFFFIHGIQFITSEPILRRGSVT